MGKLKLLTIIGCVILGSSATAFADNVTVYRWVDKNNVVHFSQHQPTHDNYTELTMSNVVKSKGSDNQEASEEVDKGPLKLAGAAEKCEEAKANVRTLKAYDKIQYTDNDGVTRVLSDKDKAEQLLLNEKHVEVYCGQ